MRDDERSLSLFINISNGELGVSLAALTELDLRTFLYNIFPRKLSRLSDAFRTVRMALQRFFAYANEHEGISYPWARAILRDRKTFDERLYTYNAGFRSPAAAEDWSEALVFDLE